MENLVGKTVERYNILNKLPEGGMGVVYGALDTRLERSVAIKFIRIDKIAPSDLDHLLKRFEREAKVLARFDHTNIVTIYDYGEYQDQPYLVMQYVAGGSLKDLTSQKMPWDKALQITLETAKGLTYAHKAGVLHRDIKPGNILMTREGKIKITDFGIARILDSGDNTQLTATGMGIGTPDYMSPEQCMGLEANPQSDIYALGVVLYELVTGNKPFTADTPMAVMIKQVHDPLPDPRNFVPDLPEELYKLLLKALAKDPADRFENMQAFELSIQRLQEIDLPPFIAQIIETEGQQQNATVERGSKITNLENQDNPATLLADIDLETSVNLEALIPDQQTETLPSEDIKPVAPKHKNKGKKWIPLVLIAVTLILVGAVLILTGVIKPFQQGPQIRTQINSVDGVTQVYIGGGKFTMGGLNGPSDQTPVIELYLEPYWMDSYEVTNEKYALCVDAGACNPPTGKNSISRSEYYGSPDFMKYPVIYVSWQDATDYCVWTGRRLPTEAEWEKAARGNKDQRSYPWGEETPTCEMLNFNNCKGDTSAIGSFPNNASPYGAFDMSGNVAEWVNDWYRVDTYTKFEFTNPTGPEDGFKKVLRGGSWFTNISKIILSYRDNNYVDFRGPQAGFRCASDK